MANFNVNCPYFSNRFSEILSRYLLTFEHQNTAREVLSCARSACRFAEKDFLEFTRKDADDYFNDMLKRRLSSSTIRVRRSRLSGIVRYVNEELKPWERQCVDYFDMISFDKPEDYELSMDIVKDYISEDTYSDMVRAADDLGFVAAPLIFGLSYYAALSASEICGLRYDHISHDEGGRCLVYVYDESFHTERTVALDDKIGNMLESYVSLPQKKLSAFLFVNKFGNPITLRNISYAFSKCCRACGLGNRYSFKDLRSSSVIRMLSEKNLSEVAGDANLRRARLFLYRLARQRVAEVPNREENEK